MCCDKCLTESLHLCIMLFPEQRAKSHALLAKSGTGETNGNSLCQFLQNVPFFTKLNFPENIQIFSVVKNLLITYMSFEANADSRLSLLVYLMWTFCSVWKMTLEKIQFSYFGDWHWKHMSQNLEFFFTLVGNPQNLSIFFNEMQMKTFSKLASRTFAYRMKKSVFQ